MIGTNRKGSATVWNARAQAKKEKSAVTASEVECHIAAATVSMPKHNMYFGGTELPSRPATGISVSMARPPGISARPDVNRAWDRASFSDDPKTAHSNARGMVTFATTGAPNTRGTQLFINYKDNSFLDSQGFLPIGQVVEGMDIVDQFYSGYGDTVNKEGDLENGGKAYVDRNMPKLDRILSATIVPAAPKPAADEKK